MTSGYYNRITLCGDREQLTATLATQESSDEEYSDDDTDSDSDHATFAAGIESCTNEEEDDNSAYNCKRKKLMTGRPSNVMAGRHSTSHCKIHVITKAPPRPSAGVQDMSNHYIERISKVVNENAKEEFSERKKLYEKLIKDKEATENLLRENKREVGKETLKLQKHEEDIQIWKNSICNTYQKIEFLDEDIHDSEDKLKCLKTKRLELSRDQRSFEGIVQEKSIKTGALKQQIQQKEGEMENSLNKLKTIKTKIDSVFKSKTSSAPESDPFLRHLDQQISQKTSELECPVCFCVCQPPILRCPEFHLVCSECWPKMRVCGECRAPYEGQMRHRYAERGHKDLQELVKTREEHLVKNNKDHHTV